MPGLVRFGIRSSANTILYRRKQTVSEEKPLKGSRTPDPPRKCRTRTDMSFISWTRRARTPLPSSSELCEKEAERAEALISQSNNAPWDRNDSDTSDDHYVSDLNSNCEPCLNDYDVFSNDDIVVVRSPEERCACQSDQSKRFALFDEQVNLGRLHMNRSRAVVPTSPNRPQWNLENGYKVLFNCNSKPPLPQASDCAKECFCTDGEPESAKVKARLLKGELAAIEKPSKPALHFKDSILRSKAPRQSNEAHAEYHTLATHGRSRTFS